MKTAKNITKPSSMIVDLSSNSHHHNSMTNATTTTSTPKQKRKYDNIATTMGTINNPIDIEDQEGYMEGPRVKMSKKMKSSILWKLFAPRTKEKIQNMIPGEETTTASQRSEEDPAVKANSTSVDVPPKEKLATKLKPSKAPSSLQQNGSKMIIDIKMEDSPFTQLAVIEAGAATSSISQLELDDVSPVTSDVTMAVIGKEGQPLPSSLTQRPSTPIDTERNLTYQRAANKISNKADIRAEDPSPSSARSDGEEQPSGGPSSLQPPQCCNLKTLSVSDKVSGDVAPSKPPSSPEKSKKAPSPKSSSTDENQTMSIPPRLERQESYNDGGDDGSDDTAKARLASVKESADQDDDVNADTERKFLTENSSTFDENASPRRLRIKLKLNPISKSIPRKEGSNATDKDDADETLTLASFSPDCSGEKSHKESSDMIDETNTNEGKDSKGDSSARPVTGDEAIAETRSIANQELVNNSDPTGQMELMQLNPYFLLVLYNMLEYASTSTVSTSALQYGISWCDEMLHQAQTGSFVITNQKQFKSTLYPKFFPQQPYNLFELNLECLGFRRITKACTFWWHEKFVRGRPAHMPRPSSASPNEEAEGPATLTSTSNLKSIKRPLRGVPDMASNPPINVLRAPKQFVVPRKASKVTASSDAIASTVAANPPKPAGKTVATSTKASTGTPGENQGGRGKPSTVWNGRDRFPEILYKMLENAAYAYASKNSTAATQCGVSWCEPLLHEQGIGSFMITDKDKFVNTIYRKFFPNQSQYRSFERNLSSWGFHRPKKTGKIIFYYHPYFMQGRLAMCRTRVIRRPDKHTSVKDRRLGITVSLKHAHMWNESSQPAAMHSKMKRLLSDECEVQEDPRQQDSNSPTDQAGPLENTPLHDFIAESDPNNIDTAKEATELSIRLVKSKKPKEGPVVFQGFLDATMGHGCRRLGNYSSGFDDRLGTL